MRPAAGVVAQPRHVLPSRWDEAQARFHAETVSASGSADRVAPLRDGPWAHLLDGGAGSGTLGACLVAPGGRWTAVEPHAAMQELLKQRLPALAARDIELHVEASTWPASCRPSCRPSCRQVL